MSHNNETFHQPDNESQSSPLLQRPALARDLGQRAVPTTANDTVNETQPSIDQAAETTPVEQRYLTPDEIVASVNGSSAKKRQGGLLNRWKSRGGLLGSIATVLLFLFKVGAPLFFVLAKLKFFLLAGGSMAVSMWVASMRFGWHLGIGIVLLICIHECGHALAARIRGIPTGIMVFIPLLGAFVTTKRYGKNLEEDAFIGIMGPIVGSIAAALTASVFLIHHDKFWLVLGEWGLFINLFNLLPTPPLDGGWIAPLFSPKLLLLGAFIAVIVGFRNPLIWLLLIMSGPRIISAWRADPKTQPYYQVSFAAKWKYGVLYFGLAALLALGSGAIGKIMMVA
jgi:Zn-dependent protease